MMELTNVQSMSSRVIAELTGKRHDHILRDIDTLNANYEKLGLPKVGEGYYTLPNTGNQQHRCFNLSRIQTMDLITGYSIPLRIKVNRRWEQLENEAKSQQPALPSIIDHILLEHRQIEDTQVKLQQQITELDEKKQRLTKARLYLINKTAIDEWREGFIKRNGESIHDFMSKNIAAWVSAGYVKASDFRTMFAKAGCRLGIKALNLLVKEWCDANGYIFKRGLLKRSGSDVFRVHIFRINPKGGVI